jgi:ATP:corrinoid adenosyltransferase
LPITGVVAAHAQSAKRLVAPKAHPWATSTTSNTETKVSGTIQEVTSQHGVTQIVVSGGNGAVTADVGPAAGKAAKSFEAGDRVEIAGWMRTTDGKNILLARQITAGERQVVIRNQHGILVHPATAKNNKPQRVGAAFAGGAR